ncbi:MAG: aldehyde dehydrogenase family protein [Candidatus Nanopelagicaceae bacterium]|jgi:acyl-CoA reductase-like NAD-dependent aldehyde dehydrogenase
MAHFDSLNPATGDVIASHEIYDKAQVDSAVLSAHEAKLKWQKLGFNGRKKVLQDWKGVISKRADEIAKLIAEETGKPFGDAKLEVSVAISHLAWASGKAGYYLKEQRRNPGVLLFNMSAIVQRVPVGVVGVIGPWNYPLFTPMGSIAYALSAGNTVVFKPSEFTPGVGKLIEETFAQVAPFSGILKCITGLGETGKYLCESAVNKLAFTGSTRTAKLVAETCSKNMVPVLLECGGKDPVIVDKDANLKLAVEYTVWSAMANAGQSCIGAERVYVHKKVAEKFRQILIEAVHQLEVGKSYGPATMPKQLEIIKRHVADAQKSGAKLLIGDVNSIGDRYVAPVVMADVPENCSAMVEETFGPTIAINEVEDMDEAIRLSNASEYGLGASVFAKRHGYKIAEQLECGMVAINSAFSFAAIASVPFGGAKQSGYGRIHGPEGLYEFTYARTLVRPRFEIPLRATSFKRTAGQEKIISLLTKWFS